MRVPSVLLVVATLAVAACARSGATGGGVGTGVTAVAAAVSRPAGVTDSTIALGAQLFNGGNCRNCHGPEGVGARNGPSLADKTWLHISGNYDEIVRVITTGITAPQIKDSTRTRAMRGRGGPANLTDEQIKVIAAYVWTLSNR